jgi:hypothetical protein
MEVKILREAFVPLVAALRKFVILAIVAIPVLWIIQWLSPHTFRPFDIYKDFLTQVWTNGLIYWDWILIALITFKISFNLKTYYTVAEKLRWDRLNLELVRWGKTPYIPSLLLFYLVTPQPSYSPNLKDLVFNSFQKDVVNMFRNRVYINSSIAQIEPEKRLSFWKITGLSRWVPPMLGIITIVVAVLLTSKTSVSLWLMGPQRFLLPVLIFIASWVVQQLYAILTVGKGQKLKHRLMDYFGEEDPKITWREVFPDRDYGNAIIKATEAYCERLQREYYNYTRKPIPANNQLVYDCPTLPPYPYPTNELPEWTNDMERYSDLARRKDEKHWQDQKVIQSSKGKVVQLKKQKIW